MVLSGYDFAEISLWSLTGLGKKTNYKFLWPTSEHKGRRLKKATLFLDGDISEKLVHESATFLS